MELETTNNENLQRISTIAMSRLARFSSVTREKISQSFLCSNDHFSGMRFVVGSFQAKWLFGEDTIEFTRGDLVLDRVSLNETGVEVRRAA